MVAVSTPPASLGGLALPNNLSDIPTLHRNVAMLVCDSAATLEETLLLLEDPRLNFRRVGATSIVFPARQMGLLQRALHAASCYPHVLGEQRDVVDSGGGDG